MTRPRATLRLQLHQGFTFADAGALVPYVASLGISHVYLSPILTARPGSMHGYDVTDPTMVNPELGGEAGLRRLVATLRRSGLGLIIDIVPNHMAVGGLENPWWGDVLENGKSSCYARFFDIDWNSADSALRGKMLAPFLGDPYGEALQSGALAVERNDAMKCFIIRYFNHLFPIRPEDQGEVEAALPGAYDPATEVGRNRLHRLLERQHYRLAWWRCAGDEINWRRFFDINGLAGLRVEDPEIFEATHATLLRLYAEGLLDGVRVDHVDGLADPPGYCRRLRNRLRALASRRPPDAPPGPAWLIVEKILGSGERLPDDWVVDGTSGYDFMDAVAAVLHDPAGAPPLRQLWAEVSGRPGDFVAEVTAAREEVLDRSFAAQLDATARCLHRLARMRRETRDTSFAAIRRAATALLAHFPVYRCYGCGPRPPGDAAAFATAVAGALAASPAALRPVIRQLDAWLDGGATNGGDATIRFQQLSAPLAAKAVEDTAFYRYGVLLSRNEVGANPARFGGTAETFHAACVEREQRFPDAMLATATHDHKRGEDVRARLAVLSELPAAWEQAVRRWLILNAPHRPAVDRRMPSAGDELMLYQMIVGAWPVELSASDSRGVRDYTERLAAWQHKALREAKLATDWTSPDPDYEEAARLFLFAIMANAEGFLAEAARFAHRIGPAGAVNGLAQVLLKLTAPGVPDFYQGTEFWDQSLVDPDNRRPVDFARRIAAMRDDVPPAALAANWRDGRVKQAMIRRALAVRQALPELFARGDYRPLDASGPLATHVVAFLRTGGEACCLVLVPRLLVGLLAPGGGIAIPPEAWRDTVLRLPDELAGRTVQDTLGDAGAIRLSRSEPLARLLAAFPVALLR